MPLSREFFRRDGLVAAFRLAAEAPEAPPPAACPSPDAFLLPKPAVTPISESICGMKVLGTAFCVRDGLCDMTTITILTIAI